MRARNRPERYGSRLARYAVLFVISSLVFTGCSWQRRGPTAIVTKGTQSGGSDEEYVDERVSIVWREDIGRSLLGPVQVNGSVLYAATGDGKLTAISVDDGERYWSARPGGVLSTPVVGGRGAEKIYVNTADDDGLIYAYSPRDGRRLWRRIVGPSRHPTVTSGEAAYGVTDDGVVYALDLSSGEGMWTIRLSGHALASPTVHGAHLFVPTSAETIVRLARSSGTQTAAISIPASVSARPTVVGAVLATPLYSGRLALIDLAAARVRTIIDLGAPAFASPVVGPDGSAYLLTRDAVVWRVDSGAFAAESVAGEDPMSRVEPLVEFDGAARASLTLADGRLYAGLLDGTLIALELSGTEVWRVQLGDSIVAPVTVQGTAVLVPLLRGSVVRVEADR